MTCHRIALGDGKGVAIVCARGQRRAARCTITGCDREHEVLCDYPVKRGTCDKKLCRGHAVAQGPEIDYCPAHAKLAAKGEPPPMSKQDPDPQIGLF